MDPLAALQLQPALDRLRARRRKRLRRPTIIRYPRLIETAYLRDILRAVAPAREAVDHLLVPRLPELVRGAGMRQDAARMDDDDYAALVGRVFGSVRLEYERLVPEEELRATVVRAGEQLSLFNQEQVHRQVKTVIGIDVITSEPWLRPRLKAFASANVRLIRSVPERYFADLEDLVLRQLAAGRRAEELANEIAARFPVTQSRAALIAQDQVGKLNGQMTGQRHADLGLSRYRWRNSRDERVRGNPGGLYPRARFSHWEREGRIYEDSKPPEDGHPGEPIRCRCWREPVFEDLLGPEFAIDQTPSPAADSYTR